MEQGGMSGDDYVIDEKRGKSWGNSHDALMWYRTRLEAVEQALLDAEADVTAGEGSFSRYARQSVLDVLETIPQGPAPQIAATHPVEGEWYWVRTKDGAEFPARRRSSAAGGWSNDDTWEDFDRQVKWWSPILASTLDKVAPPI
jgi:hypothetical protein